jgi:hypothetical protein
VGEFSQGQAPHFCCQNPSGKVEPREHREVINAKSGAANRKHHDGGVGEDGGLATVLANEQGLVFLTIDH